MRTLKKDWITKIRHFLVKPVITGDIPLEYAFTIDGTDYFAFVNVHEIPVERMFALSALYEELQMRMTRAELEANIKIIESALDKPVVGLNKIRDVVADMKERMNYIIEVETVYNIAALLFVKRNENLLKYDPVVAEKKKQEFMKADIPAFFLSMPLEQLSPFSKMQVEHIIGSLSAVVNKTLKRVELTEKALLSEELMSSEMDAIKSKIAFLKQVQSKLKDTLST